MHVTFPKRELKCQRKGQASWKVRALGQRGEMAVRRLGGSSAGWEGKGRVETQRFMTKVSRQEMKNRQETKTKDPRTKWGVKKKSLRTGVFPQLPNQAAGKKSRKSHGGGGRKPYNNQTHRRKILRKRFKWRKFRFYRVQRG